MKLTEEKKEEIRKLRATKGDDGKPLTYDTICDLTGVSKPYVMGVCALAPENNALNGVASEQTRPIVHPISESRAIIENSFLHTRIKDLEDSQRALKNELNEKVEKLHGLQMEHNKLKVDFDTLDIRKDAEVEKKLLLAEYDKNKGLGGLLNDKDNVKELFGMLKMAVAGFAKGDAQNNQAQLPNAAAVHPLINDPLVGEFVKQIYDVLPNFKKDEIEDLYKLIATFFVEPGFLKEVSEKAVLTINLRHPQYQTQTQN